MKYEPWNEKEAAEKDMILDFLRNHPDALERTNLAGHMTVSAWVVNPAHTKVLMAYHKLYDSWAWLGGHADGCADLAATAVKEACEEAGLQSEDVRTVSRDLLSLEVLPVSGHMKKGKWVPSHLHYNVTYLLEASEDAILKVNEEENTDVAWFPFEEVQKASKEEWFIQHIYPKLIEKTERK
jgi:8-oxo-dGTP pyrophosphatase MutT (NUDIX family)